MNSSETSTTKPAGRWRRSILLLLVIPYIGTLWVSSYNSIAPEVWGIPFFYWYQFLWIAIGAIITIIVYATERPLQTPPAAPRERERERDS
jgi:hypothetical protein